MKIKKVFEDTSVDIYEKYNGYLPKNASIVKYDILKSLLKLKKGQLIIYGGCNSIF